jgi:hypothetical protein
MKSFTRATESAPATQKRMNHSFKSRVTDTVNIRDLLERPANY